MSFGVELLVIYQGIHLGYKSFELIKSDLTPLSFVGRINALFNKQDLCGESVGEIFW